MSSGEEETSPAMRRVFKAHMKDKRKQEKTKMVQEVADDKMAAGKDNTKEKKYKVSRGKGAKDCKEDEVSMRIKLQVSFDLASGIISTKIIQNVMLKIEHIKK